MTTTLTEQNEQLLEALATAKQRIQDELHKQCSYARDVRAILYNIAADAMTPLPVSLQVVMPDNNAAIMGEAALKNIEQELKGLEVSLR